MGNDAWCGRMNCVILTSVWQEIWNPARGPLVSSCVPWYMCAHANTDGYALHITETQNWNSATSYLVLKIAQLPPWLGRNLWFHFSQLTQHLGCYQGAGQSWEGAVTKTQLEQKLTFSLGFYLLHLSPRVPQFSCLRNSPHLPVRTTKRLTPFSQLMWIVGSYASNMKLQASMCSVS